MIGCRDGKRTGGRMKDKEFYTTVEVTEILGIKLSIVRKYASLLEGYNYPIQRDYSNNRVYTKANIKMLQELRDLREKFTLAEAADLLTTQYRKPANDVEYEKLTAAVEKLKERLHNQESMNQTLADKVRNLEKSLETLLTIIFENDEDGYFIDEYKRQLNDA